MRDRKRKRRDRKYYDELEQNIRKTMGKIRAYNLKLDAKEMRTTIERICRESHTLMIKLKERPQYLHTIGPALKQYIDTTHTITEKSKVLHSGSGNKRTDEIYKKVRTALTKIEGALSALQEKITSEDLLELDIQLEIVESDLEIDGLS